MPKGCVGANPTPAIKFKGLMMDFLKLLSIKQRTRMTTFEKRHSKCESGAIGGGISYIMTPTGLGVICDIRCNICHAEATLNDLGDA